MINLIFRHRKGNYTGFNNDDVVSNEKKWKKTEHILLYKISYVKEIENVHISQRKDKKKYQNKNTHMNTSSKKPYRYKVFMNEQDTDKGVRKKEE